MAPDAVHTPGGFLDLVVILDQLSDEYGVLEHHVLEKKIAKRAAAEIQEGLIINLGIGIPTLIPKYLAGRKQVVVHSENGILGRSLF